MGLNLALEIEKFRRWMGSDQSAAADLQDRRERVAWFGERLSRIAIENLNAEEFAILEKRLWATNFFRNKDYKVQRLLDDNGLDKIRRSLATLLYGSDCIEDRWDEFRTNVKGLGPASISELLTLSDPKSY